MAIDLVQVALVLGAMAVVPAGVTYGCASLIRVVRDGLSRFGDAGDEQPR